MRLSRGSIDGKIVVSTCPAIIEIIPERNPYLAIFWDVPIQPDPKSPEPGISWANE
jgi:hypothetical protein